MDELIGPRQYVVLANILFDLQRGPGRDRTLLMKFEQADRL
jgi:hypothetical protein